MSEPLFLIKLHASAVGIFSDDLRITASAPVGILSDDLRITASEPYVFYVSYNRW